MALAAATVLLRSAPLGVCARQDGLLPGSAAAGVHPAKPYPEEMGECGVRCQNLCCCMRVCVLIDCGVVRHTRTIAKMSVHSDWREACQHAALPQAALQAPLVVLSVPPAAAAAGAAEWYTLTHGVGCYCPVVLFHLIAAANNTQQDHHRLCMCTATRAPIVLLNHWLSVHASLALSSLLAGVGVAAATFTAVPACLRYWQRPQLWLNRG